MDEEKRPYALPRDPTESARLDLQAHLYEQNIGYALHPKISDSIPPQAEIADVACGTGIWMLRLASATPAHRYHGLDMSTEQFPTKYPENCTFGALNLLHDIPGDMACRFDVVHMSLLVVGLTGNDWQTAAANALKLLKPGGWLQWCESDFEDMNILQSQSGAPTQAMRESHNRMVMGARKHGKLCGDASRLLEIVQEAGFKNCNKDTVSSDRIASTRSQMTFVEQHAILKVCISIADQDQADTPSLKHLEDLRERCEAEIADGKAYLR